MRPESGKWKRLGTLGPRSAPGVGSVPGPGEQQQLMVSRNGGRAGPPAGCGPPGGWQVPPLPPKETHSEGPGQPEAWSQGFHAYWVEKAG